MSDRTIQRRMSEAWEAQHRFPATLEALQSGRITKAHLTAIIRCSDPITDPEQRAIYEQVAIARAEVLSVGRLNAVLPAIAEHITNQSINTRHREARKSRGIWIRDTHDGMAELTAALPAVLAHGIYDRVTTMARTMRSDSTTSDDGTCDDRSLDNIRADIFTDLCLTSTPLAGNGLDNIHATVAVTVPVLALAGLDDTSASLAGSGPIDADTARRLAGATSGWDRVMTHPITGTTLAIDRYRPSADLKRALRIRDEHCRFPGCRMPEHRSDRDHSEAYVDDGTTEIDNLAILCRRHHTLKHAANWTI